MSCYLNTLYSQHGNATEEKDQSVVFGIGDYKFDIINWQALREELQRRRGSSVGSGGNAEDAERIRALEDELERCCYDNPVRVTLIFRIRSSNPLTPRVKPWVIQSFHFVGRTLKCDYSLGSC